MEGSVGDADAGDGGILRQNVTPILAQLSEKHRDRASEALPCGEVLVGVNVSRDEKKGVLKGLHEPRLINCFHGGCYSDVIAMRGLIEELPDDCGLVISRGKAFQ